MKKMTRIGDEMSIIADGVQWTPETAHLFRKSPPSVVPGFFDQAQGRYLEDFPVLCQVRNRINAVLSRLAQARALAERELMR